MLTSRLQRAWLPRDLRISRLLCVTFTRPNRSFKTHGKPDGMLAAGRFRRHKQLSTDFLSYLGTSSHRRDARKANSRRSCRRMLKAAGSARLTEQGMRMLLKAKQMRLVGPGRGSQRFEVSLGRGCARLISCTVFVTEPGALCWHLVWQCPSQEERRNWMTARKETMRRAQRMRSRECRR